MKEYVVRFEQVRSFVAVVKAETPEDAMKMAEWQECLDAKQTDFARYQNYTAKENK